MRRFLGQNFLAQYFSTGGKEILPKWKRNSLKRDFILFKERIF